MVPELVSRRVLQQPLLQRQRSQHHPPPAIAASETPGAALEDSVITCANNVVLTDSPKSVISGSQISSGYMGAAVPPGGANPSIRHLRLRRSAAIAPDPVTFATLR